MSKTILVVEDNSDHSEIVQKILSAFGYEIEVVINGKDAIGYCKSHEPPFLILMDILLPDMNGVDVIKQIKKMAKYTKVPIVAVTIQTDKDVEKKIIESGCSNILFKPYLPAELVKMVEQYV